MSRALRTRLERLEQRHTPLALSRVVVVPWRTWPTTDEGTEAMHQAHPHGRFFIPTPMTAEEWEAIVPAAQARL